MFSNRTKTRTACRITSPKEFVSRRVQKVCCGENHTLFLMEDHTIWSCGGNHKGQLALPRINIAEEPTQIDFPFEVCPYNSIIHLVGGFYCKWTRTFDFSHR
jgi:alpha-tubulin suppressor-like RCC1 family protein